MASHPPELEKAESHWRERDPAGWERRRRTFEATASAYHRYRPGYPRPLFDDLRRRVGPERTTVLEVGAGTGRATVQLAALGPVTALEPAAGMAALLRRSTSEMDVRIVTDTFERWTPDRAYDLLASAQAWHWVEPSVRYARAADALRPGGTLALFWNVAVCPAADRAFHDAIQDVYRSFAPTLAHEGEVPTAETAADRASEIVEADGFEDVEVVRHRWSWTLDRDDYLGLLGTHSPHAALDERNRRRLFEGIGELIDRRFAGRVTEHYVAMLHLARRG